MKYLGIFLAYFTISHILELQATSSGCFPCSTLRRKWITTLCENTIEDCGECFHGYQYDFEDNTCQSTEVDIRPGELAVVAKGNKANLICQSDNLFDCAWTRRGNHVDRNDGIRYSSDQKIPPTDCNLKIVGVNEIDDGDWSCQIYCDPLVNDPCLQKHMWIHVRESEILTFKPSDTEILPYGESAVLECHFLQDVTCDWTHNGAKVGIGSRYSYISPQRKDLKLTDCSIKIDGFQNDDVGAWQCIAYNSALKQEIKKPKINLQPAKPALRMIETPESQVVEMENSATLRCRFNYAVNCQWMKDGSPVTFGDRYGYVSEENGLQTADCSLKITSFQPEDVGEWSCSSGHNDMSKAAISQSVLLLGVELTKIEGGHPDVERSFECSVLEASGQHADILWHLNDQPRMEGYFVKEENEDFIATSKITTKLNPDDDLKCVVRHPALKDESIADSKYAGIKTANKVGSMSKPQNSSELNYFRIMSIMELIIIIILGILTVSLLYMFLREKHRASTNLNSKKVENGSKDLLLQTSVKIKNLDSSTPWYKSTKR